MAKKSKKAFVDAVKAKGGVRYFDLGGGVSLAPTTLAGSVGGDTVNNGITSFLTPQSGYAAQLAPTTQMNYAPVVNAAANNALSLQPAFNQNLTAEQALLKQFQDQATGVGPNPAQAALAQATGNNVANAAAVAAGTRGASQNAGAVARGAAQTGAAIQQQAVGQGATLQAQQQLAGGQAAAGLTNQIGQQVVGKQAADTNLFGTGAGASNTQNANLVSNYGQAQGINAATAANNTAANQKTASGLLEGISSGIMGLFADGGEVGEAAPALDGDSAARSFVGKFLSGPPPQEEPSPAGMGKLASAAGPLMAAAKGKEVPGKAKVEGDSLKNDNVPAMLSPGEIVLPRSVTQAADAPRRAAAFVQAIQAKQGLKRGKKNG